MPTWDAHDPILTRPIATSLERCAELATNVEPYIRAYGTKVWSLMQLERQLQPEAYRRRRGGYLDRRRPRTTWAGSR
jgi:hypothetical protein